MKNIIATLTQKLKSKTPAKVLKHKKKVFLAAIVVVLLLIIPMLTLQKINEPFEKFALRFNRPPALSEIPKEASGASILSSTGRVSYPHDYTIVLLGDSMTERLGNTDELRGYLSEEYPGKTIEILNYGYGATNLLSVKKRLLEETDHFRDYAAITKINFDLIIIESFANNPLSEYQIEEGLKLQEQKLDETIQLIKENNPTAKIAFLATIAPNKYTYAKSSIDISDEKRLEWVAERVKYFENHIKYANDHNIPLINVYKDSQDIFGNGKTIYIDDKDFIHPSPLGVIFISQKIAEEIQKQNLLPQK